MRIQKEIDNILTVWEQMIDIAEIAGIVSVAALAALIGGALAPESAGLSAVGLAALAAGLSALISEAGTEIGNVPQPTKERAAKAAYNARSGGAASASAAALQVLRDEQPVIVTEGAFVIYWNLWGGLRRAFDPSADIGDWTPYQDICTPLSNTTGDRSMQSGRPLRQPTQRPAMACIAVHCVLWITCG